MTSVTIYTDGSCHTRQRVGAWAAILLIGSHKQVLSGSVPDTTHNRMELTAVIKALEYLRDNNKDITNLTICSDSQYVIGLTTREPRLSTLGFTTKKGKELPNADLVKELLDYFRLFTIEFVKIKAHQKKAEIINYNIEADYLARKLVRAAIIPDRTFIP
jgi:ribonuclease HI